MLIREASGLEWDTHQEYHQGLWDSREYRDSFGQISHVPIYVAEYEQLAPAVMIEAMQRREASATEGSRSESPIALYPTLAMYGLIENE